MSAATHEEWREVLAQRDSAARLTARALNNKHLPLARNYAERFAELDEKLDRLTDELSKDPN